MVTLDFQTTGFIQLENEIKKEKINSCLIYYKDDLIFEYYKNEGSKNQICKVNSVTKSVLSIVVGIAIDRNEMESVHTPISKYYPSIENLKNEITIEHLLTMTAGFEWNESGPFGSLPVDDDWVQFVINKKLTSKPGEKMVYSSGCSQLLSDIMQKSTGKKLSEYAKEVLFDPLGITEYFWQEDGNGSSVGGFGLMLLPKDMLKLGILMMNKGKFQNSQIVSESWVTTSTSNKCFTDEKTGAYSYHWWNIVNESVGKANSDIFLAIGFGGQMIFVNPTKKYVVVFTADLSKQTMKTVRLFKKYIMNQFT